MQHHHHPLPHAGVLASMSLSELMGATLRLSDLMSEESVMLQEMRIAELPKLQEEKMKLATLLEAYQQRLSTDPGFVKNADERTQEELLLLTDDLAFNVEENFRQVATARAVNSRILQAMMDVLNEEHQPGTYGKQGQSKMGSDRSLSMNLNQKA